MKNICTKIISVILSISVITAVLLFSNGAYAASSFSFDDTTYQTVASSWQDIQNKLSYMSLSVGSDVGELRFSWVTDIKDFSPKLKISQNKDMDEAENIEVKSKLNSIAKCTHTAEIDGLEQGKTYYYSYTESGVWSKAYSYTVQYADKFSAIFVSDSQIGRSGDSDDEQVLKNDTAGWWYTMNLAQKTDPDAAFVLSAGDQVEDSNSLTQYKAYLSAPQLRSLPEATAMGNHDFSLPYYKQFFNNPNTVKETVASFGGNGYYFKYGDVLFIVYNSNDMICSDVNKLTKAAVSAYPDTKWRVAMMHHSPYSARYDDDSFSIARSTFSPVFDAYGVDLVLSGHDHFYSRSYPMNSNNVTTQGNGTVYVQSGSASGSNIGSNMKQGASFISCELQDKTATYSVLSFSADSIGIKSYRTDTNEEFDNYTLTSAIEKTKAASPASITVKYITTLIKSIIRLF